MTPDEPATQLHPIERFFRDWGSCLFVYCTWLAMILASVFLLSKYAYNVPWQDEWIIIDVLTGDKPLTLSWLWTEHNEHRIPLVKLILLLLYKSTGDFRAPIYATVASLGLLALAMIRGARKLRGWTSYTDAFFPLVLLNWAHAEVFLWAFEVQYALSIVFTGIILLIIVEQRGTLTLGAAILAGLCLMMLPLTGANGLVQVPALAGWLITMGLLARSSQEPAGKRNAVVMFAFAGASLAITGVYFIGFKGSQSPRAALALKLKLHSALQYLTGAFGPSAAWTWPYSGLITGGLFLLGLAVLVVRIVRGTPEERSRALGLFFFLGSMVSLILAMGWGRSFVGFSPPFIIMRYYLLATPASCALYFVWTSPRSPLFGRSIQVFLFAAMSLAIPFNMGVGLEWAKAHGRPMEGIQAELQRGTTPAILAEHYAHFLIPGQSDDWVATRLERMHKLGIGPFRSLDVKQTAVREMPLPVEPTLSSAMSCTDGKGRFFLLGEDASLTFNLEKPRYVHAIRLRCSYGDNAKVPISFRLYWKSSGKEDGHLALEVGDFFGALHPYGTTRADMGETTITVLVNDTIDSFLVQPDDKSCFYQLEKITLLVPE